MVENIDQVIFERSKNKENFEVDYWKIKYYLYLLFFKWVSDEQLKETKPTWGGSCVFKVPPDYSFGKAAELIKTGEYKEIEVVKVCFRHIEGIESEFQKLLMRIEDVFTDKVSGEEISEDIEMINGISIGSVEEYMDIYEKIMDKFLSWRCEHHTPSFISDLVSRLIIADSKSVKSICDPCSGSGVLLNKCLSEIGGSKKLGVKVAAYGVKEKDVDIFKMGLLVQGFLNQVRWGLVGDDINDPYKYQFIVSHPDCAESKTFSFILKHLLSLDVTLNARLVLVLPKEYIVKKEFFRVRKYLIDNNFLDCVIDLPKECFHKNEDKFILVLRRKRKHRRVFLINASDRFAEVDKKFVMKKEHIDWLVDIYENKNDSKGDAVIIPGEEIVGCNYNICPEYYLPKKKRIKKTKIIIIPTDQVTLSGSEFVSEIFAPIVEIAKFIWKYMFIVEYGEKDVMRKLRRMEKKHKNLLLRKEAKLRRMKMFNKNLV